MSANSSVEPSPRCPCERSGNCPCLVNGICPCQRNADGCMCRRRRNQRCGGDDEYACRWHWIWWVILVGLILWGISVWTRPAEAAAGAAAGAGAGAAAAATQGETSTASFFGSGRRANENLDRLFARVIQNARSSL